MSRRFNWLTIIIAALILMGAPSAVGAADMPQRTPLPGATDVTAATTLYLKREATLLQLRARFDVISADDIAGILAGDARAIAGVGPGIEQEAALDQNLLAEGSYYIVSLQYLVQSGGALWPSDKAENTYVNDALAKLAELQAELFSIADDHGDPLPVFVQLDQVNAWTEGYADLPAEFDHFEGRDALVEAALAAAKPVGT